MLRIGKYQMKRFYGLNFFTKYLIKLYIINLTKIKEVKTVWCRHKANQRDQVSFFYNMKFD